MTDWKYIIPIHERLEVHYSSCQGQFQLVSKGTDCGDDAEPMVRPLIFARPPPSGGKPPPTTPFTPGAKFSLKMDVVDLTSLQS
jgi:hypothetical protein